MKSFHCVCGQRVFFENTVCESCGAALGFDPAALVMRSLRPQGDGSFADQHGNAFRFCRNYHEYGACNWLVPAQEASKYCTGCARTKLIPSLDVPGNVLLWRRVETAKRRLLYTVLLLDLPLDDSGNRLQFRFMEDRRRNPDVFEAFISTGHHDGTITINIAEADNVAIVAAKEQMLERYRTLLGHFRHESGHYYMAYLLNDEARRNEFRALFGDERADYSQALDLYYKQGPPSDWEERFISSYAAAHPYEDWAESFAHYLHIVDALETGHYAGWWDVSAGTDWLGHWMDVSVTLNEVNRSLGVEDSYPFIITGVTRDKLRFIDRQVSPQALPWGAQQRMT